MNTIEESNDNENSISIVYSDRVLKTSIFVFNVDTLSNIINEYCKDNCPDHLVTAESMFMSIMKAIHDDRKMLYRFNQRMLSADRINKFIFEGV